MLNPDIFKFLSPRYYKIVEDGYLVSFGTGLDGEEIDAEEYELIRTAIATKPTPPEGFDYRLTEELEWEQYELPPEPDPMDEVVDPAEALTIIAEVINSV